MEFLNESSCRNHTYRNAGNLPLLRMLNVENGRFNVLDIGCGCGANAALLVKQGCAVDGITINGAEYETASLICSRVWIHDLDSGLPEDIAGPFDIILLSHVLEHLRAPEKLLLQIHGILDPGGRVAVGLPNIMNWHQRLLFLAGLFEYRDEGIMDKTHLRFFTFASGKRMLENCGYLVRQAGAAGSILPWGRLRCVIPETVNRIDRVFCSLWPALFGRQVLYIAQLQRREPDMDSLSR